MTRPVLLDLFCGAGGAGMGYYLAGFDVVGVDINPQPNYPFKFIQEDAVYYGYNYGHLYAAVHASPPCQPYTRTNALTLARNPTILRSPHDMLIEPIRDALLQTYRPFVIENVPGAPLREDLLLCGSMFLPLRVRRHRVFEIDGFKYKRIWCRHKAQRGPIIGVFGDHPDPPRPYTTNCAINLENAQNAMDMHWMTWRELCEAIPSAYTNYIGRSLIKAIK